MRQQQGRHCTLPRTDFHHVVTGSRCDHTNDFGENVLIGQKILPETLARYVLHCRDVAICAATAMASIMLVASA